MAWAHMLGQGGGMSNPFEYREVMKAAVQFGTTKTVEEVLYEQELRRKQREQESRRSPSGRPPKRPEPKGIPRKAEMDKLNEMMALVKPQLLVAAEVASPPDE